DLEFWELTENGGSQWKVEDMPGDCGHDFGNDGVSKYFATSFRLCLKRQVINLLDEGYSAEALDEQPPVHITDWYILHTSYTYLLVKFRLFFFFVLHRYCARTDCGCIYQITVSLLDENQEVIQEFKPEPVTLDPESDNCSWKE
ncbi:hypothetical protein NL108_012102, partial [Boleophthalmus pectinirostris]